MASDSWIERVKSRGPVWALPYLLLVSAWRFGRRIKNRMVFKMFGVKMGERCHIGPKVRMSYPHQVQLGRRFVMGEGSRLASENPEAEFVSGKNCEVGRGSVVDFSGGLTFEDDVLISEDVLIYTHDHGYDPHSKPTWSSLSLGEGCWVGARAIILPSVNRIGKRSVIGAGAVVAQDVPDDSIFVGAKGRVFPQKKDS